MFSQTAHRAVSLYRMVLGTPDARLVGTSGTSRLDLRQEHVVILRRMYKTVKERERQSLRPLHTVYNLCDFFRTCGACDRNMQSNVAQSQHHLLAALSHGWVCFHPQEAGSTAHTHTGVIMKMLCLVALTPGAAAGTAGIRRRTTTEDPTRGENRWHLMIQSTSPCPLDSPKGECRGRTKVVREKK